MKLILSLCCMLALTTHLHAQKAFAARHNIDLKANEFKLDQ